MWSLLATGLGWLLDAVFGKKAPDIATEAKAAGRAQERSEGLERTIENVAKAQDASRAVDADIARGVSVTDTDGFRRD